ncbi:hypothetical protein AB0K92_15835 [Streptomyces sp. NPDC052687]|uniref:hypothetical protein n=1 Tax=Streptomyces sp. NPDC052687 TaxID=3154759 RepID=UPI003424F9F6
MTHFATHRNGRGLLGSLLHPRRERKQHEAHVSREARLVELKRSIEDLERWHHEWRLRWDPDYRALHPGEWCGIHDGPVDGCDVRCLRMRASDVRRSRRRMKCEDDYEITTWTGHVIRPSRPSTTLRPDLRPSERRRAARNVAEWARTQVWESDVP